MGKHDDGWFEGFKWGGNFKFSTRRSTVRRRGKTRQIVDSTDDDGYLIFFRTMRGKTKSFAVLGNEIEARITDFAVLS